MNPYLAQLKNIDAMIKSTQTWVNRTRDDRKRAEILNVLRIYGIQRAQVAQQAAQWDRAQAQAQAQAKAQAQFKAQAQAAAKKLAQARLAQQIAAYRRRR